VAHLLKTVSVLFNEPKLLKSSSDRRLRVYNKSFSALQRAEIAEIATAAVVAWQVDRFSALQRAEIAEMLPGRLTGILVNGFSALQRAEIAEITTKDATEMMIKLFQCSSTSRNC